MTLAIHTNNSAPSGVDIYIPETYEVLSTILSALCWRKHNGYIKLYADNKVYDFYAKHKLLDVWNQVITTDFNTSKKTNHKVFWAASKFYAIENENPPFFIIDTDFIVWNTLKDNLLKEKLIAIHDENIEYEIYPSKENLQLTDKQLFLLNDLNWKIKASNTAFAYFNDIEFKKKYISMALDFIKYHDSQNCDKLIYMVLVEQRLFSMVADQLKLDIKYLLNDKTMSNQSNYTHLWGLKNKLKNNQLSKNHFNSMCMKRIAHEFPQYLEKTKNTIETLEREKK